MTNLNREIGDKIADVFKRIRDDDPNSKKLKKNRKRLEDPFVRELNYKRIPIKLLEKGYELDLSSEDQENNENELPMELVMPKALETELQIIKDTKAKKTRAKIAVGGIDEELEEKPQFRPQRVLASYAKPQEAVPQQMAQRNIAVIAV